MFDALMSIARAGARMECRHLGGAGGSRSRATALREGRNLLRPHPHPVPLRQLHLHFEEPMAGVRGARPRRVRQVRLAEDGVHPHLAVGIEVRRP